MITNESRSSGINTSLNVYPATHFTAAINDRGIRQESVYKNVRHALVNSLWLCGYYWIEITTRNRNCRTKAKINGVTLGIPELINHCQMSKPPPWYRHSLNLKATMTLNLKRVALKNHPSAESIPLIILPLRQKQDHHHRVSFKRFLFEIWLTWLCQPNLITIIANPKRDSFSRWY